ncbi:hypothetical protein XI25_12715 [Paenibacillus sp. DMB20]|nr:hypothetical protein XI25_12715 [Paenibacillus sp. DMB20]
MSNTNYINGIGLNLAYGFLFELMSKYGIQKDDGITMRRKERDQRFRIIKVASRHPWALPRDVFHLLQDSQESMKFLI